MWEHYPKFQISNNTFTTYFKCMKLSEFQFANSLIHFGTLRYKSAYKKTSKKKLTKNELICVNCVII